MDRRPLLAKGIIELEALYDERIDEPEFIEILIHELSYRKTKRAHDLKARAENKLSGTEGVKPVSAVIAPPMNASPCLPKEPQEVDQNSNQLLTSSIPELISDHELDPLEITKQVLSAQPLTDEPENILTAWTAMEVLSPSSFRAPEDLAAGDRRRIAKTVNGVMPWENGGERSKKNYRLYYQVIIGSVAMEPAVSALLKIYTDTRDERPQARGESVLATVMVDSEGRPVDDHPVSISSFGWGIPYALAGQLKALGNWPLAEKQLTAALSQKLVVKDDEDLSLPLTSQSILDAHDALISATGLDRSLTSPPSFVVRTYQYFKNQGPPEAMILNSFFLYDLAKANSLVRNGRATGNLQRYLGMIKPQNRRNLMMDKTAIESAVEPNKFPLGSWPASGRHPLVLLQQCAVNLVSNDLKKDGILAVNGPPGTGKTTLLRDVIAAVITQRAEILTSYSDPEKAFTHSGQKIKKGNAFIHLYKLDDKVRGSEIIVASSNNKAVENVSAELPAIDAIAEDATTLRYFKTVSDNLLKCDTWGTIAAVLGNGINRANFRQDFWWDEDHGLQTYLQHAVGNPKFIIEKNGDETIERPPNVSQQEDPPRDHDEAIKRWKKVRQNFQDKLDTAKSALSDFQEAHDLMQTVRERKVAVAELDDKFTQTQQLEKQITTARDQSEQGCRQKAGILREAKEKFDQSLNEKPGFIWIFLKWSQYQAWKSHHANCTAKVDHATQAYFQAQKSLKEKETELDDLEKADSMNRKLREKAFSIAQETAEAYETLSQQIKGTFIDDEFSNYDHKAFHITAPWLDKGAARIRNDLFEASMAVHKAFVDAAAKPIRHNLNVLMDGFGISSLGTSEKDALIPDLWSTLFLVVPVVSTTFASVSRMFGRIEPETFGWLLIDEAGQALPQAAIGALIRTKKAVIVGDPIQIEPVVVLPDKLTEAICKQFGVDPHVYNAPTGSAQTLGDNATSYFGSFETQFGTREVGVPLLVHRRCTEPMFSISNAIAYENLMVQAKAEKGSSIRDTLGPSRWINVQGQAQEKWCPEEGQAVLELLRSLRAADCQPDLYIVTPFVVVQNNLRNLLRSSHILDGWADQPERWCIEHVGTVHTVQGREAEAVIFVLGAPKSEQRGARGWAGGQPNLLNVAATRAKEALYVVGNADLWKSAGVFKALYERMK